VKLISPGGSSTAGARAPAGMQITALPACETTRRLLAVEYARLHWRLKTVTRADSAEGWWLVQVSSTSLSKPPRPLLSELAASPVPPMSAVQVLDGSPCLRFFGLKGPGDEVYDLVGHDGLLGLRPGNKTGEATAFVSREASVNIFKKITGQAPGPEPIPVRQATGWAQVAGGAARESSLRVLLDVPEKGKSFTKKPANATATVFHSQAAPPAQDGWDAKADKADTNDVIPDDWEDDA